jgi:hypothetical protein
MKLSTLIEEFVIMLNEGVPEYNYQNSLIENGKTVEKYFDRLKELKNLIDAFVEVDDGK